MGLKTALIVGVSVGYLVCGDAHVDGGAVGLVRNVES